MSLPGKGAVIDGRYRVEDLLGEGGAAAVLRCTDLELEREVAVKLLRPDGITEDPRRMEAEARSLARLEHPHVLRVFAVGRHDGGLYLVTEILPRGSLAERVAGRGLSPERSLRYAREVLEALAAAHEAGILHRDVKPANVLLDADDGVRLGDFGLAKSRGSGVHTATGMVMGTPEYMAPELMQGVAATPASDLYSWGCLVYHLVNGRPPFQGSLAELSTADRRRPELTGLEPVGLVPALRRALDPDPAGRGTARELLERLAKAPAPGAGRTRVMSTGATMGEASLPTLATARRAPPSGGGLLPRASLALTGLGALALGWHLTRVPMAPSPAARPPPPPEVAIPSGEGGPAARAREWVTRLSRVYPETLLKDLHARMGDLGEGYLGVMLASRQGPRNQAVARVLAEEAGNLPLRAELAADRAALRAALLDPALPLSLRLELFRGLQRLDALDVYHEAWGLPRPYALDALLGAFTPLAFRPWRKAEERARPPPPPRRSCLGLFTWPGGLDSLFP